jgi:hypothetical protein
MKSSSDFRLNAKEGALELAIMKEPIRLCALMAGLILLAGCKSPEFACNELPPSLDVAGPSIVVLPMADSRSNRLADQVFRNGYLTDVQGAIGQELQSMRYFSSVTIVKDNEIPPKADLQLTPTLQRLDWELPHHGRVETAKAVAHTFNFIGNVTLGLPVGNLYLHSGTPVCGNSALNVAVRRRADQKVLLDTAFFDTVTNRFKKSDCDKAQTKATVMLAAFENTQAELREELLKQLLQEKYANAAPKVASPKNSP